MLEDLLGGSGGGNGGLHQAVAALTETQQAPHYKTGHRVEHLQGLYEMTLPLFISGRTLEIKLP